MTSYKESRVNSMDRKDKCSSIAYSYAKKTFLRKGIGRPLILDWGFSGPIDMGDHFLLLNDDGVGTKLILGLRLSKLDTLGYDLLAMVADDAVCQGGEVIAITNTIDVQQANENIVRELMKGLAEACKKQNVVIAGGEIAELGKVINYPVWNASAVAIVEKEKLITGKNVKVGDALVSFRSAVIRSNGLTLARHILKERYGENWYIKKYDEKHCWGEILLTPSIIYHSAVLDMIGRFGEKRKIDIHGIAHITGGGIPGNLARILGNFGADLKNLFPPHPALKKLQTLGKVSDSEAYNTWNMGNGMILAMPKKDAKKALEIARKNKIDAQVCGEVVKEKGIKLLCKGAEREGTWMLFLIRNS